MAKEEHIPHPLYADEPIDIVAPDWVAKSFYLVPRLKMKARKNPKTPWELKDEIKEKMENRRRAMEDYDKKTGRKGKERA